MRLRVKNIMNESYLKLDTALVVVYRNLNGLLEKKVYETLSA